tara:strand:- start:34 stop:540 length:507 start_codon:yes stop_codon:yes gene_type:complete
MRKTLEVSVDGDPVAKLRLSSRGFCEWFMLVQMFIFMVIISHGTLQTAKELQKFNDMLTLNVTVEREPPSNTTRVTYEYLVDTFYVPCYKNSYLSGAVSNPQTYEEILYPSYVTDNCDGGHYKYVGVRYWEAHGHYYTSNYHNYQTVHEVSLAESHTDFPRYSTWTTL